MVHELTHLLVGEIILPQRPGDGGVPRWVDEGIASYMAGGWSDDQDRLVRDLVAAGNVPALSQLTGGGGFGNPRLNDALGHVAFDYIESRWGPTSIRRFIDALIVPRVDETYDAVFDLTPAEFTRRSATTRNADSGSHSLTLRPACGHGGRHQFRFMASARPGTS